MPTLTGVTILHRTAMIAGAGLADVWILFRDGQVVDVWVAAVVRR